MQTRYVVVVVVYVVAMHTLRTHITFAIYFHRHHPHFTAVIHHWSVHSGTELGMFAFSEYLCVSVCCNASKLDCASM